MAEVGFPWIALLVGALGSALLMVGVAGLPRLYGRVERHRRLRASVEASEAPTVLTDLSGRMLHGNAAMRDLAARVGVAPEKGLVALLDAAIAETASGIVYRMTRIARTTGFAVQPTRSAESQVPIYLSVWASEDDILRWSLTTSGRFDGLCPSAFDSPYEATGFAHAGLRLGAPAVCNTAFRRRFGPDPVPVLAALPQGSKVAGDRVLLTCRDGTVRVFRAFLIDGETGVAAAAGTEPADLFLFPVETEAAAATGPTRVLSMVPVALAEFEADGTLLWFNDQARQILGSHAEPGRRIGDMFASVAEAQDPLDTVLSGTADGGRTQMVQLRGGGAFLRLVITPVRLHERETLLAVLTDASDFRQLEDQFAQSQKMEAVGKLAGGVAHDFNNVLTAIVGHCDLLLLSKDASHPDYSDLIQITQNANRAAALVRQLLAFSREQTLNPEVLSVQDVVSETHYLLGRLVGETISLHLEVEPDLWTVRADHQQLEQVLLNLVVNARDAMKGSGAITIGLCNVNRAPVAELKPGEGFVEISVRDTGPGIDPEVIDKVFDPFFTTKAKGEGTGLGLSTVYGIVKQSGGHIVAGNGADGGACFRIYLPRSQEREVKAAPGPAAALPARDLTGKGTVLLVEDEDPVRSFAARALRLRGYEVHEAATGEEAMALLADPVCRVDLIVSDVVMPGMDGPTFAAEARRLHPEIGLIFVSGYAEESFRKNLAEMEFMFLPKPFSLNELTAKVKEALADGVAG